VVIEKASIVARGPGRHAPARFGLLFLLALLGTAAGAQGQTPPERRTAASRDSALDATTAFKLVWSTIAAVDHANRTGNYSVLRDLGAPSFQSSNDPARLAANFSALRNARIDLETALVVTPALEFPPTIMEQGLLRIRGSFPIRPSRIGFDLLYQNVSGQWRLFGIAVAPLAETATQAR
jgi:hypothetical protein